MERKCKKVLKGDKMSGSAVFSIMNETPYFL